MTVVPARSRTWRRGALAVGLATAALIATGGALAAPASAMGSGDSYEDLQVGVTYTVYEPKVTAGLALQHFGSNVACPKGTEENGLSVYGRASARQFTLTQGNPMCSDIGEGTTVATVMVKGAKATVVAYCEPQARCTKADVRRLGGHLSVQLPAAQGLRSTTVWIETAGSRPLSANTLIRIARGLRPAA